MRWIALPFLAVILLLLGISIMAFNFAAQDQARGCLDVGGTPITAKDWLTIEYLGCVTP